MEKEKILELLADHPLTQELIQKQEAEIEGKRKKAITARLELLARLEKEAKNQNTKVEAAKKSFNDADTAFRAAQETYNKVVLEKRQAIGLIECEISQQEGFLKASANPKIESFARGLRAVQDIIRVKTNGANAQINQTITTDFLTDQKTITVDSIIEAAKEKMAYIKEALERVSQLYLLPFEEAEKIIDEIADNFPDALRRIEELETRSNTFILGKWEITRTIENKSPMKKTTWFDLP